MKFVGQPFVCGALGDIAEADWAALLSASVPGVVSVRGVGNARLAVSPHSVGFERTASGWTWGRYIARSAQATSVESAANELGLAGYWEFSDRRSVVVHGDVLGFQDLFYRFVDNAVFFSNRIAPLVALRPAVDLHVDWYAWARFFTFLGFTGSDTGFAEVRRLQRGERLILCGGVPEVVGSTSPDWLRRPETELSIDHLADVLVDVLREFGSSHEEVDLTLSGGHDSRLVLASLLVVGTRRVRAHVTPHESGWDDDTRIAREVARVAGIEVQERDWSPEEWRAARYGVARRLEYQSALHTWFEPLAHSLGDGVGPLFDGLAGDKLLHYHADTGERTDADRADTLRRIGGWRVTRPRILRDRIREAFSDNVSHFWEERTIRWSGHPYSEALEWLEHRTNRVIASAPFRVFGPERAVVTPLIDPMLIAAVFSSRQSSIEEPDIRQRLLRILNPRLAAISSTNDPALNVRTFTARGLAARSARLELAESVRRLPFASDMFESDVLDSLSRGRPLDADALILLRVAGVLSDWYCAYEGRLANRTPEWS